MTQQVLVKPGYILLQIDGLGRLVIPKSFRQQMGLDQHTMVEVSMEGEALTVRKHYPQENLNLRLQTLAMQLDDLRYANNLPEDVIDELAGCVAQMQQALAEVEVEGVAAAG